MIGIALSYLFTRPVVDELAGQLLGNGVFPMVTWVGVWYPFHVLFIAQGQANREARVSATMASVPVVVQTSVLAVPRLRRHAGYMRLQRLRF